MNAIQFIQQHGVEKARGVVEGAPTGTNHYCADNYWFWDVTTLRRTAGDGFFIHSIWGASEEWVSKAVSIPDLKRLVESVDMVKEYGGISMAKRQCACFTNACTSVGVKPSPRLSALQQAIADYESIESCKCVVTRTYENGTCNKCGMQDMGDDSHIENNSSKNCKVIDYE